ncbi:MAG: pilus assembly protein, partial [Desulfuromonadales bacterium]|nr:pilus assembly protein [Desulfuromonadales bacterium]
EFTIIFPFLMYMILSIAEAGSLMARAVMLDRGVEIAMRDLRLGRVPGITHQEIKDRICDAAFLIGKCRGAIQLELAPLPSSASFPETGITCIDRTSEIQPVVV